MIAPRWGVFRSDGHEPALPARYSENLRSVMLAQVRDTLCELNGTSRLSALRERTWQSLKQWPRASRTSKRTTPVFAAS